jgi:anti-sigma28 factor (negative regulator of flagellin synthesis)
MRVDQRYLDQAASSRLDKAQETQAASTARTPSTSSAASGQGSDQVQLSDLSGRLLDVASLEQPGHTARLAELTAAVRGGTYRLDDVETAKGMIQEATRNVN